jgi:hypothetical protein
MSSLLALRLDPAALARQRAINRLHAALLFLGLAALAGMTGLVVLGPDGLVLGAAMVLTFLLLARWCPAIFCSGRPSARSGSGPAS